MPPASNGQRCLCTYRQCGNRKDRKTGEVGVELNSRNYRIHQEDEKRHNMKKAMQAQRQVIEAQEESIEDSLSRLSISQRPKAEASRQGTENKYRTDQARAMIAIYTAVLEDIAVQESMVNNIPTFLHGHPDLNQVYDVLRRCRDARFFVSRTEGDALRKITTGPLRNEPSVEAHRENCILKLRQLEDLVSGIEPFWLGRLEAHKKEIETRQALASRTYDTASHFLPIMEGSSFIIHLIVFMVVVCHMILGLSRRGCWWLFSMSDYIIQTTAYLATNGNIPLPIRKILNAFPRDIRAATAHLHLDAKGTVYAACPKCNKLYKSHEVNGVPSYREKCNYRKHRKARKCKTLLLYEKHFTSGSVYVPIKPFVVFDFIDWLAGMMSRKDIEKEMDAAWDRMSPSPDGSVSDIFQASYIRNFKGPDGNHFSENGDSQAGRYLFSLGFDFFNPFRNLAAGKKVSIGIIALICLNLPIDIRYRPENIFLAGIIPGPKEPSLDAINPYFAPIVDVFLELWKGVFLSRTASIRLGRLILCALIAIIADLPAARKAGGFVACTHDLFCSLCWCSRTVQKFDDFDYQSWRRRTNEECRTHAQAYSEAVDPAAAQRIVDKTGLRSSEFLRLPYYDPTKNLIVDPMHNLFLGLIKEHFQNIIGCKSPKDGDNDDDEVDLDLGAAPTAASTEETPEETTKEATEEGHAPSASANNVPATHPRLSIRPSANNPLPEGTGRQAVRRLTEWLNNTENQISVEEVATVAARFTKSNTTVSALVYIGKAVGCFPPTMTPNGKDTAKPGQTRILKPDLANALVEWQRKRLAEPPQNTGSTSSELFKKQGKILTSEEMRRVRRDIKAVVKPSWVTSIPTTISSSGPKLKSDQWRVAGSLYLPITLVRQWTRPKDATVTPEHKELLDLTMHLFSAVCIITSRVTSERLVEEFQAHMVKYRTELDRIFPKYKCHPNHHMAMHLHEFVSAFGPVHGWWTFPFERMIGTLQRIPINYKQGEYEETIARTWHKRANLKALLDKINCPEILMNCKKMYTKLTKPLERNSMAMLAEEHDSDSEDMDVDSDEVNPDYRQEKEKVMPLAVISAFQNRGISLTRAIPTNRYRDRGVLYTAKRIHEGNSCVLICIDGVDVPFSIKSFLQLPSKINGSSVWIVVHRHRPSDVGNDPFAAYPYLRAKMWSPEWDEKVEVFPSSAISGQFAKCEIPWVEYENEEKRKMKVVVCVSLSRVQAIV